MEPACQSLQNTITCAWIRIPPQTAGEVTVHVVQRLLGQRDVEVLQLQQDTTRKDGTLEAMQQSLREKEAENKRLIDYLQVNTAQQNDDCDSDKE